ncbi:MAG: hypothetical protein HWQ42_22950 [Nostoc sp. JL23]|nr:hypothetical protein [Nostoc sp. JL23]
MFPIHATTPILKLTSTERLIGDHALAKLYDLLNLEISTSLSIAESTVKSHINRILSKLTVNNHTQVVIVGVK